MEFEESCHQNANDAVHNKCRHDEDAITKFVIVLRYEFVVEAPGYGLVKVVSHKQRRYVYYYQDVAQKEQEVLSIPKADAIVDPWTMMVHV